MTRPFRRALSVACAVGALVVAVGPGDRLLASARAQTAAPAPAPSAALAKQKALLDKYCVTCHNDRVKTANLSLQNADLSALPAHAELWEKVIRKLRAGVMPPPDMP